MLDEFQLDAVWRDMLAAETRALYFADLATRVTRRKQWITGATLFLSSGAAVSVLAQWQTWVATVAAVAIAGLSAYVISANLDGAVTTLLKLHMAWSRIQHDYERLWSHTYSADAERELEAIQAREIEVSEQAAAGAPYKEALVAQWQERVNRLHSAESSHAA